MTHGYDIRTSIDFFRKLLDEREDFLKTPSSARHAINCAITAWQLHDWIFAEKNKYPFMNQFNTKNDFRKYLYSKEDFRTLHDLADGAKHYELTSRNTTIIETKVSSYKDIRERDGGDDSLQLFITMDFADVGLTMSFNDLLYLITLFWYKFFSDELQENVDKIFDEGGYSLF